MHFRKIPHGSPAYDRTVALRDAILRKPLGLTFTKDQLEAEQSDFHLVAESAPDENPTLVACLILSLVPSHPDQLHLRQMAVAEFHRGQGIGRDLMRFAEQFARNQHFSEIKLHARQPAVPFYQKLGYHTVGAPFLEVTLPHQEMRKPL
jgi:predicted GNAT family N-acyltransferase